MRRIIFLGSISAAKTFVPRAAEQKNGAVARETIDRMEQELTANRTNLSETEALSAGYEARTERAWIALLRRIIGRKFH